MAALIATPAMLLPDTTRDTIQIVGLFCLVAAILTFSEYSSSYPSLIEFRDAAPFNRIRFAALFLTVIALALIARSDTDPSTLGIVLSNIGLQLGTMMDFPFSPIHLMALAVPEGTTEMQHASLLAHAGLAFLISITTIAVFVTTVRLLNWPLRNGAFNFWVNLPLFDPTAGGDVLARLKRDANFNVALGCLLPFLVPAILKIAAEMGHPFDFFAPQTLIWTVTAWAFLPASLVMRGVALMRIADLIAMKRRRAYAQADLQAI